MSKVLKADEVIQAICKLNNEIDCQDHYIHFMEDLGKVLADHAGGDFSCVSPDHHDNLGVCVLFDVNECVPADGGVYKEFDTDVTWKDGVEI